MPRVKKTSKKTNTVIVNVNSNNRRKTIKSTNPAQQSRTQIIPMPMPFQGSNNDHNTLHILSASMANLLKTHILHGNKTGDGNPPPQTPAIHYNNVATPPTAPSAYMTRRSRLLFEASEPQRPGLMQNAQEIPPHPFSRRRNSDSDSEQSGRASSSKLSLTSKIRTPMYGNDMNTQTGMGFHHNNDVHHKAQIKAFEQDLGAPLPGLSVKEQRKYINSTPDVKDAFRQFQIQQPLSAVEHGTHEKVMVGRPRDINKH